MKDREKSFGISLGVVALIPASFAVIWLDLSERLSGTPSGLALLGVPVGISLVAVSNLVMKRKPWRFFWRQQLATLYAPARYRLPVVRTVHVFVAATGEELLFRLIGFWLLGHGALGFFVTTSAFALCHLAVARKGRAITTFLDAGLGGAALGGLYLFSGGVAACVIAHFLRNFWLESLRLGVATARQRTANLPEGERGA